MSATIGDNIGNNPADNRADNPADDLALAVQRRDVVFTSRGAS